MRWCWFRTVLLALTCGVFCTAAPARAAIELTGPTQVQPGETFSLVLSLTEAWPLGPGEGVDQVDITLSYDPAILVSAPPSARALLAGDDVSALLGEVSTVSFQSSRVPFGPGELIEYHFTAPSEVLQAVTVSFTAEVVPTMGDFEPLAPLPVATANVQVVPEPSMWLLLAAGLGCLTLVRMRLRQPAPALGSAG